MFRSEGIFLGEVLGWWGVGGNNDWGSCGEGVCNRSGVFSVLLCNGDLMVVEQWCSSGMSNVNGDNKHVLELMGALLSLFGDTGAKSGWRKELQLQLLQLLHTGSEQGGFESLSGRVPGVDFGIQCRWLVLQWGWLVVDAGGVVMSDWGGSCLADSGPWGDLGRGVLGKMLRWEHNLHNTLWWLLQARFLWASSLICDESKLVWYLGIL